MSQSAEFVAVLEGRRPEMRSAIDHRGRDAVDDHDRPDRVPGGRYHTGRSQAAFEVDGGGAEASAGRAEFKVSRSLPGGLVSHLAIGRIQTPILVAAIGQIEDSRLRDERHNRGPDRKADPVLSQMSLHAACRIEAECRTSGENDRVDAGHELVGFEQIGLSRGRSAAQNGARGHRRFVEEYDRYARSELRVMGVADAHARYIGDQIAKSGSCASKR